MMAVSPDGVLLVGVILGLVVGLLLVLALKKGG